MNSRHRRRKGRDFSWIQKSFLPAALGVYIVVLEMSKPSSNVAIVALGALMANALPVAILQLILEGTVLGKREAEGEDDEPDA